MKKSSKKEILQKLLSPYTEFRKEIFDENLTVYLSNFLSNYNDKNKQIVFVNCVFKGNLKINNIKCKRLEFKDCRFLDGGGIKNREKDNALYIKNFIFKPYELEGDFVIDLGAYADENGLINDKTGCIENLEFENHQKGSGRVFFIGLNDKLEFGNFRNRILDNVIFENCDLRRCVFLNSKVDKAEFRNVKFIRIEDEDIVSLNKSKFERGGCFISFISFMLFFLLPLFFILHLTNFVSFLLIFIISFVLIINLFIFIIYMDSCYIRFLTCLNAFFSYSSKNIFKFFTSGFILFFTCLIGLKLRKTKTYDTYDTILNTHLATYDERLILNKLMENKTNDYNRLLDSFNALTELYNQLAINFLKTDKQLWGEFMYSSKFYKNIVGESYFVNVFANRLNHLVNGYGRRWFRALWWILFVIFYFGYLFTDFIKPNIDYVSTKNTPYFLLKNVKFDNKKGIIYYSSKSFTPSLKINYEFNKNINKHIFGDNLYGYDNRFNFNDLRVQYILNLKANYWTGLCKSLSNLLYPFSFENKKWFENVTPKAFILSIIESMILWLLILALIRALWNVIVY